MPHGTGINKSVENKAIRLADKAMAWKMAELDAIMVRQEVFDAIRSIKGDEGELLYLRYVELKKWHEIASEMDKTERWIYTLAEKSLKKFELVHCSSC